MVDGLDMLISTGIPVIQSQHLSVPPFASCQSQFPCQSCTCQSHSSQLGLSDPVWAHLSEPWQSELALSETMSEPHLSEPHYQRWELSEIMSECTFIARIIRDYVRASLVRATLIRPGLSDHIRATLVTVEWRWIHSSVAVPVSVKDIDHLRTVAYCWYTCQTMLYTVCAHYHVLMNTVRVSACFLPICFTITILSFEHVSLSLMSWRGECYWWEWGNSSLSLCINFAILDSTPKR